MEHQIQEFPGFMTLLSRSVQTFKKGFKYFAILLALDILIVIIGAVIGLQAGSGILLLFTILNSPYIIFLAIVLFLVSVILRAMVQISTVLLFSKVDSTEQISLIQLLKSSIRFIIPLSIVNLLAGMVILVGFALLIIPGIIVAVWLSLTTYAVIFEKKRALSALRRSRFYVRGYTGVIFLYHLGGFILSGAIVYGPQLFLAKAVDPKFMSIYQGLVGALLAPLWVGFEYYIYKHLRDIKGAEEEKEVKIHPVVVISLIIFLLGAAGFVLFSIYQNIPRRGIITEKATPRPSPYRFQTPFDKY